MSLKQDIQPYIIENSSITLQPNSEYYEDNPHLFAVIYLILSKKLALAGVEKYDDEFDAYYHEFMTRCELVPV